MATSFLLRPSGRTAPLRLDRAHNFPPDRGNVRKLRDEKDACAVRTGRLRCLLGARCSGPRELDLSREKRKGAVLVGSRHRVMFVSIQPAPERSVLV